MNTNQEADSYHCGSNITALYGPCIASDYRRLQSSGAVGPVYSGVPFEFTVVKKDAYNNTILSDSASLLRASAVQEDGKADQRVSILGFVLSQMTSGVASFQFAVKATFSTIDYVNMSAALDSEILLSIGGADDVSGSAMQTDLMLVQMQQGTSMCPPGLILTLDKEGSENIAAVCTLFKPGTYSISPMARTPQSKTSSPACINCPAGLECNGGADVQGRANSPGTWRTVSGVYYLVSCPASFQLVNSSNDLQQCKPCSPGQYIIDPIADACQHCPAVPAG